MPKMKSVAIAPDLKVTIQEVDFPSLPSPDHLIIQVVVSGCNPKDWAMPQRCMPSVSLMLSCHANAFSAVPGSPQGDDIAGIVHSVGSNVTEFRPGDRVASFHEMFTEYSSFGEYAIGRADTTFHLPPSVSFEEAATIPLAATTAALGLYQRLALPVPWRPAQERLPLVIYSAASAVGAFAVKLAKLSNIHPLICVAGNGCDFVQKLIDPARGDVVLDYRQGSEAIVRGMKAALHDGEKLIYAFDAVADKGSFQNIAQVMDHHRGKLTVVLARKEYKGVPSTVDLTFTQVGKVHGDHYPALRNEQKLEGELGDQDFGAILYRFFGRGLAKGWFTGHPYEVREGGLSGIEGALKDLQAGKASAVKYVFRIADPPEKARI